MKTAIYTAFTADTFVSYEQFAGRDVLHQSQLVDIYLAELRQLSLLIGGLPERGGLASWRPHSLLDCEAKSFRLFSNGYNVYLLENP